jgi:uncharacterized protein YdbL (DUF1318 family)
MFVFKQLITLTTLLLLMTACVTINVYFPAAAAEKAADEIINEVWGTDDNHNEPPADPAPQTRLPSATPTWLAFFISDAQASADIDVSSPAIQAIQQRMANRHKSLEEYYDNGAIGLTNDGFITVRDPKVVPLRDRNKVNGWVAEENQDRRDLYQEIASANGHPEWEDDIRETFAKRWIQRAKKGWWYQDNQGNWQQK